MSPDEAKKFEADFYQEVRRMDELAFRQQYKLEGRRQGLQHGLGLLLSARFGEQSADVSEVLSSILDVEVLLQLITSVATVSSLEDLRQELRRRGLH